MCAFKFTGYELIYCKASPPSHLVSLTQEEFLSFLYKQDLWRRHYLILAKHLEVKG